MLEIPKDERKDADKMKIKDVSPLLSMRKIAIYEAVGEDIEAVFPDLYIGEPDKIPPELLERDICCIGIYDRCILEIQVKKR